MRLLRELPHHLGLTSPAYPAAAASFSAAALAAAAETLHGKLWGSSGRQQEGWVGMTRRREQGGVGTAGRHEQGGAETVGRSAPAFATLERGRTLDLQPAEIACLAEVVHRDLGLQRLCIRGEGVCIRGMCTNFGAWRVLAI